MSVKVRCDNSTNLLRVNIYDVLLIDTSVMSYMNYTLTGKGFFNIFLKLFNKIPVH